MCRHKIALHQRGWTFQILFNCNKCHAGWHNNTKMDFKITILNLCHCLTAQLLLVCITSNCVNIFSIILSTIYFWKYFHAMWSVFKCFSEGLLIAWCFVEVMRLQHCCLWCIFYYKLWKFPVSWLVRCIHILLYLPLSKVRQMELYFTHWHSQETRVKKRLCKYFLWFVVVRVLTARCRYKECLKL